MMLRRSSTTFTIVVLELLLVALISVVIITGYQLIYSKLVNMGLLSSEVEAPADVEIKKAALPDDQVPTDGSAALSPGLETTETTPENNLLPDQEDDSDVIIPQTIPTQTITPQPTEGLQESEEPEYGEWFPCPGTYASRLHIGDRVYVSYDPPLANRLRSDPDKDLGVILVTIEPGEDVKIKDGPVCANGWVWWYVREMETGFFGWTAEGDTEDYWLVPFP